MSNITFQENCKKLFQLIKELPTSSNQQISLLMQRYIEQNLLILNDVVATSVENINKLKNVHSAHDIINIQSRFTQEINKNLALSNQRFLDASLGQISDYNEWLKSHCDFVMD